jgi:hypothetical protein
MEQMWISAIQQTHTIVWIINAFLAFVIFRKLKHIDAWTVVVLVLLQCAMYAHYQTEHQIRIATGICLVCFEFGLVFILLLNLVLCNLDPKEKTE